LKLPWITQRLFNSILELILAFKIISVPAKTDPKQRGKGQKTNNIDKISTEAIKLKSS
jgi:hypothetical protein